MRKLSIVTALLAVCAAAPARAAVDLPDALRSDAPRLRLLGSGRMTWFGLHLYDAALWTAGARFDASAPFALALRYKRRFDGASIAQRSVAEIERLGLGDAGSRARWGEQMRRVFTDVEPGDTLTGVYRPGWGAEFFHNQRALGAIADPEFAGAFFAIWLDPRTREPRLRARLIGAT
jgi:hypothetical protein